MNVLFIGDIMGEPGREAVRQALPGLTRDFQLEFVIANGENSAGGKGISGKVAEELFCAGVNVITLGNHTWARKEVDQVIDDCRVLRPSNYPPGVPGHGWNVFLLKGSLKLAVVSLMGRVFIPPIDCPFRAMDPVLEKINLETRNVVVDFHGEATSEKQAMGWYLNGRVSAVIGTHTHVQTADARILPEGTAYLTDAGMCGSEDSVIGMNKEIILKRYLTGIPNRFIVAEGSLIFNGCIISIDENTGRATAIENIFRRIPG